MKTKTTLIVLLALVLIAAVPVTYNGYHLNGIMVCDAMYLDAAASAYTGMDVIRGYGNCHPKSWRSPDFCLGSQPKEHFAGLHYDATLICSEIVTSDSMAVGYGKCFMHSNPTAPSSSSSQKCNDLQHCW